LEASSTVTEIPSQARTEVAYDPAGPPGGPKHRLNEGKTGTGAIYIPPMIRTWAFWRRVSRHGDFVGTYGHPSATHIRRHEHQSPCAHGCRAPRAAAPSQGQDPPWALRRVRAVRYSSGVTDEGGAFESAFWSFCGGVVLTVFSTSVWNPMCRGVASSLQQVRVRRVDERLQLHAQPVREPREQVERDDKEELVRLLHAGVLLEGLILEQQLVDNVVAPLEDGLRIGHEGVTVARHWAKKTISNGTKKGR
ncbi:hypothetical protein K438DRAFT_2049498, partial [Mycena galopus ATCC 62051]